MRCLLDTHALAWWLLDLPRLGFGARQAIATSENSIYVSAVSAFEIATNTASANGRMAGLVSDFDSILRKERFEHLPISVAHAFLAGRMSMTHGDPFDRILAAQCKLENLSLTTIDAAFNKFAIDTIW